MICVVKPETIGMKVMDMLRTVIKHLPPTDHPFIRSMLTILIDRGYLEISKTQACCDTSNSNYRRDYVEFFRTIKYNLVLPFQFIELHINGMRVVNDNVIAKSYWMQTNIISSSSSFYPVAWNRNELRHERCNSCSKIHAKYMGVWNWKCSCG